MSVKTVALLIVLAVLFEVTTVTVVGKSIESQTIQFNKSRKPPIMRYVIKVLRKKCDTGYMEINEVCYKTYKK